MVRVIEEESIMMRGMKGKYGRGGEERNKNEDEIQDKDDAKDKQESERERERDREREMETVSLRERFIYIYYLWRERAIVNLFHHADTFPPTDFLVLFS